MATVTVNTDRFDPYENFRFRIVWEGRTVAGVSRVTALKRATEVIEFREGGNASNVRKTPGPTKYEPITLERGVTRDPDFVQWGREVWGSGNPQARDDQRRESSLAEVRKDITIELYNKAGQKVMAYVVHRCWVSEFRARADLAANGNVILIESIKLENEGWERDPGVAEPSEPTFTHPEV